MSGLSVAQIAAVGIAVFNIVLAILMLVQYRKLRRHMEASEKQSESCRHEEMLKTAYEYIRNLEKQCQRLQEQLEKLKLTTHGEANLAKEPEPLSKLYEETDPRTAEIAEILYLSDRGKSSRDIAALLGKGVDEVELILALHKRIPKDIGYSSQN